MEQATLIPIEKTEATALVAAPPTLMQTIQLAVQQGASIEVIERMWAMEKEYRALQAEQEFDAAMSRTQAKIATVMADLSNSQTHSNYPSYKALDDAVRPHYTAEGFSVKFGTAKADQESDIRVTGTVKREGHAEDYHIDVPVVTTGIQGKAMMTKTHATLSAITYGQSKLLRMMFNIAVMGQREDDDGNGGDGNRAFVPDEDGNGSLQEALEWIDNCRNIAELQTVYQPLAKKAQDAKDTAAGNALTQRKNKRYRELTNAK